MSNHSEQIGRLSPNNALMSTPHGAASASRRRRKCELIIFTKTLDNGNLTIIISPISFVSQPGIHRKGAMESRNHAETALTAPAATGGWGCARLAAVSAKARGKHRAEQAK